VDERREGHGVAVLSAAAEPAEDGKRFGLGRVATLDAKRGESEEVRLDGRADDEARRRRDAVSLGLVVREHRHRPRMLRRATRARPTSNSPRAITEIRADPDGMTSCSRVTSAGDPRASL